MTFHHKFFRRRKSLITAWWLLLPLVAFNQLTFRVGVVPTNTPTGASLYVAGNFQGWDPGHPGYQLTENPDGSYAITINPAPGLLKYKFTRGNWQTVEGNANGGFLPDREYTYAGGVETLEHSILSWEDLGGSNSTAAANVHLLADSFYLPQLDRYRRVWIYLPPDYDSEPAKHYPVLYLHDGQNVFDDATSFAGEWHVDEALNDLFDQGDYGCIAVAIENGGTLRIDEYAPWQNAGYQAGGEGAAYTAFVAETLKPHVDANYRTLPQPEYTGIMGSSLGGLITHYALLAYPDVFGKAGVFSPAFWFNPEIFPFAEGNPPATAAKVFLLAGALEGNGSVVADVNQMESILFNGGHPPALINKKIDADGQHSEWYWAREFPGAYLWLFGQLPNAAESQTPTALPAVFPNPTDSVLHIRDCVSLRNVHFRLWSADGTLLKAGKPDNCLIALQGVPNGLYLLQLLSDERIIAEEKIMIAK